MQERPFDYPGSQSEEHFEVAERIGGFRHEDEDGESYTVYTVYAFSRLVDEAEITEVVRDLHPTWHCTHSHDCCANFYPSSALWSFASRLDRYSGDEAPVTVIVSQKFHCNI